MNANQLNELKSAAWSAFESIALEIREYSDNCAASDYSSVCNAAEADRDEVIESLLSDDTIDFQVDCIVYSECNALNIISREAYEDAWEEVRSWGVSNFSFSDVLCRVATLVMKEIELEELYASKCKLSKNLKGLSDSVESILDGLNESEEAIAIKAMIVRHFDDAIAQVKREDGSALKLDLLEHFKTQIESSIDDIESTNERLALAESTPQAMDGKQARKSGRL